MNERSGTVRLVERREETEVRGLVTTISRKEVEDALHGGAPVDLLLDVERAAADGGRETERIALAWEPEDLERALASASGDKIALSFDDAELQRLLEEDVEAHGMREKLAVLTVVAGIAAAGAGTASGMTYGGGGSGGSTSTPTVVAPASEVSTGITATTPAPAAAPSEFSTGIVQEPAAPPAEVTTGIVREPTATPVSASPGDSWSPSGTEIGAIVAGAILAIGAAGFAVRTQRHRPATA